MSNIKYIFYIYNKLYKSPNEILIKYLIGAILVKLLNKIVV